MKPDQREKRPDFRGLLRQPWGRWLLGFAVAELGLLLALTWLWNDWSSRTQRVARPRPYSTASRDPYFAGHPGPWGELEYVRINIEPPDDFVTADETPETRTCWFFAGHTRAQVEAVFAACALPPPVQAALRDTSQWTEEAGGVQVVPAAEAVLALPPDARAQLYSLLARDQRNDLQALPFVYRQGGLEDWLSRSGLESNTLALVKQLVYPRGSALCFSDLPLLNARIADPAERHHVVKTLSRTSTLLMKLRVRPESDVPALTAYWARGWHVKDVGPLLESLTRVPGSITVDVAHLLPPFARQRINSYPPPLPAGQRAPDCYWTAFNFFNDTPDDRYFDDAIWRRELQERWAQTAQPTYGDLLFLVRPDGVPIHAAVFIADDVFFTKNGANLRQPWKLMKLEDLLARYPTDVPLRVAYFRSVARAN